MRFRALLTAGLICAISALVAPAAGAAPASFAGVAADGKAVFFSSTDKLVPGDTDTRADVYVRSYDEDLERYVTRQVSFGPVGGNDAYPANYVGVSAGGEVAFFATDEKLVSGDQDLSQDLYARDLEASTTQLVSDGDPGCAPCGDAELPASSAPGGVVPGGKKLFFGSAEQLSPADDDSSFDVYVRDLDAGTTTLVSSGSAGCAGEDCGNGAFAATFRGASADGDVAFFASEEKLAVGDDDGGLLDIYRRDVSGGTTVQVSVPGDCPSGADCSASFGGNSPDGSHAFFETKEQLSPGDPDSAQDVYDWTAGGAVLVSTGAAGGDEDVPALYVGASADGSRVFFETSESLLVGDEDEANDVYERVGGSTVLVSIGSSGGDAEVPASLRWISPDGSSAAVFFTTEEQITGTDDDAFQDVYSRQGGTTTLLTAVGLVGNGPFDASFAGASADGSHLFVVTEEPLVGADEDSVLDVYEFAAGNISLVSTGPLDDSSAIPAGLPNGAVSADGSHAIFTTEARMTEVDLDAETDVYDHFDGDTLLASTGNFAPLGPPTPSQLSTDPGSPATSLTPRVKGQSDPNTSIKIYTTADCSGAPIGTGTQAELGGAGIQVTVGAESTTSFRATATDSNGDTSPCSAPASYAHQPSTPPPGEEGGGGTGPTDPVPGVPTGGANGSGGGGPRGGGGKGGVIYVTPHTRITFAPASKTRARRPIFRFTDSTGQDGTSFKCKLDRERWRGCSSPLKLKRLKLGRHVLQVKGVNAIGSPEPAPVRRAFKVVAR